MLKNLQIFDKIINAKEYDKAINLFFNEFELYGVELSKYTKNVKIDGVMFDVKLIINPTSDSVLNVFLESNNILVNMKLVNKKAEYNKSIVIHNRNSEYKLYDFKNIRLNDTERHTNGEIGFYAHEKNGEVYDIHDEVYIRIEKNKKTQPNTSPQQQDYISFSNGKTKTDVVRGTRKKDIEDATDVVMTFLETKDKAVLESYKTTLKYNSDSFKVFERDEIEDTNQIKASLKVLEDNKALKKYINAVFDSKTSGSIFDITKYVYNSNVFVNIVNPNITFNPNIFRGNENNFRIQVEDNNKHYLIMKSRIAMHTERLKFSDVYDLDFDFVEARGDSLIFSVTPSSYHRVTLFTGSGKGSNREYCELVNKVIKEFDIIPLKLNDLAFPNQELKDKMDLLNLSDDKNYIEQIQVPFKKLHEGLLIQNNTNNKLNIKNKC